MKDGFGGIRYEIGKQRLLLHLHEYNRNAIRFHLRELPLNECFSQIVVMINVVDGYAYHFESAFVEFAHVRHNESGFSARWWVCT